MIDHPDLRTEDKRATSLHRLSLLDAAADPMLDSLTRHLAEVWHAPIAAISMVDTDRQWFQAKVGLAPAETPQAVDFCARLTTGSASELVIEDALAETQPGRTALGAADPCLRFFAGVPLLDSDGNRMGALCVMDRRSRIPTTRQLAALHDLGAVVSGSLQLQRTVRQLAEIAVTDPLTGLYNRKGFELLFDRHCDSALGLLALDLDNLKMLNDRHGHAAGDAALVALGRALRASVRASDVVARLGGDEFMVLVKDAGGLDACEGMADRVRWHLARLLSTDERFALVGVSIGTHFEPMGPKSLVAMMLAADKVLYERKANARRSVGRQHGAFRTR